MAAWVQAFSLRKHEVAARIVLGVRRHFLLNQRGAGMSIELSGGAGYGVRFGGAFVRRTAAATENHQALNNIDYPLIRAYYPEKFVVHFVTVPINVKIGCRWGR